MLYTVKEIAATLRSWGVSKVRQLEQITTEILVNMPTEPVISSGGGQDMQVAWEPTDSDLGSMVAFVIADALIPIAVGITEISLNQDSLLYVNIQNANQLVTVNGSLPEVVSANSEDGISINIRDCQSLTSFSLDSLVSCKGPISMSSNDSLTSVSFASLVTTENDGSGGLQFHNFLMTTIDVSSYVPFDGEVITFTGCALSQQSVDHILERCVANAGYVSGTVNLSGGTNSAPSGTGALMVIDLTNRGVSVTTN